MDEKRPDFDVVGKTGGPTFHLTLARQVDGHHDAHVLESGLVHVWDHLVYGKVQHGLVQPSPRDRGVHQQLLIALTAKRLEYPMMIVLAFFHRDVKPLPINEQGMGLFILTQNDLVGMKP